jgi:hypothetical protein
MLVLVLVVFFNTSKLTHVFGSKVLVLVSTVRRHRRRLRCGKMMASNFSVLQQRLYVALRNGEVRTEYWNRKSVVD